MNYLKLVRNAMRLHDQQRFTGNQLLLYLVLIEQFNRAGEGTKWPESLWFQDDKISTLAGLSINKMKEFRQDLQERHLIVFKEPGRGIRIGTQYWLGGKRSSENDEVKPERSSEKSSERLSENDDLKGKRSSENDDLSNEDHQKDHQKSRQKDCQKLTTSYIYRIPNKPNHQTTKQTLCVADRDVAEVRLAWVWLIENIKPKPVPVDSQKKGRQKNPPRLRESPPPSIVSKIRTLIETHIPGYYWSAKDGGAARDIAVKLKHAVEYKNQGLASDEEVINALSVLITRSAELPTYYRFTDLPALNSKFNEIITQLRNPKPGNQRTGSGARRNNSRQARQDETGDEIDRLAEEYFGASD